MCFAKRGSLLVVSLLLVLSARNAAALSPPWEILWSQIRYSIGEDPLVTIDPLDTSTLPYVLTVRVRNSEKASAMASILLPKHQFGNIAVNVRVLDGSGVAVPPTNLTATQDVGRAVNIALASNQLFVGAFASGSVIFQGSVGVLLARAVVQFFEDDIGELYGSYNAPAATVFGIVLKLNYGTVDLLLGTQRPGLIPQLAGQPN